MSLPEFSSIRSIADYISLIPDKTPFELYELIKSKNYIGQDEAVKSLCLMAFRHIRRLKKIYIDKINPELLPKKQNSLLVGPTGCGKTYLIELLFKDLLNIPTVIIDITSYSETGYVGQDVSSILTRLFYAANNNPILTSIGIVCLDEFDKIASGQNSAVFAGAGTTKDVSGLGVQRELLKMLESAEIPVSTGLNHSTYSEVILIPTRDVAFIACGAFSGFKLITGADKSTTIGFARDASIKDMEKIAVNYSEEEVENITNFQKYGFLPELIARFNRIIPFRSLNINELALILEKSVIEHYKEDFELDGIALEIDPKVTEHIAKKAINRETGARGIESILMRYIESSAFDAYSALGTTKIILEYSHGKINARVI